MAVICSETLFSNFLVDLSTQMSPESTFPFASKHRFEKNAEILEKEATAQ